MAALCPCPVCSRGGSHGTLLLILAVAGVAAAAWWVSQWAGWARWWMTPVAAAALLGVGSGVVAAVRASFAVSSYVAQPKIAGEVEQAAGPVEAGTVAVPSPALPVDELATRRARKKAA